MVSSAVPWSRLVLVAATGALLAAVAPGCGEGDTVGSSYEEITGSGSGGGGGEGASGSSSSLGPTGPTGPASSSASSSTGHGGATASSSSTGGAPCADGDPAEPNESESSAFDLGGISDDDDAGSSRSGVLADLEDADWFKYKGDDTILNVVDPTREITTQGSLRLCKFVQCDDGNPEVSCPGGTTPEMSPDGRSGCCGSGGFDLGLDCSGIDDNAWVYIRVDSAVPVCLDYTLAWHF
ncbi:MAG: hypothetical protein WKG00_33320 [Polyangiaceae bacterium]